MEEIQKIIESLSDDLQVVDKTILEFAVGKSPLIADISKHLISSGGKRIRPILLLLAAKLCGSNDIANQYNLAAAVELIHSATLLHDDVVDASQIRRGKKTANAIWDNKAPILVGDYLFSVAFQLMVRSNNLPVLALLSKASSIMADGEIMQLENSNNIDVLKEKYIEIIFGKTAVLFSAATECGALINNCQEKEIIALRDFGRNLGIIFQIIDDVLDYKANKKVFGKDLGGDFFEGKVTLPIIISYQESNDVDKKMIRNLLEENLFSTEKNQNKFLQITSLIDKYNGFDESLLLAKKYQDKAVENLSIFPNSIYKDNLLTILEYSFNRKS